jgi:hypothetical protein
MPEGPLYMDDCKPDWLVGAELGGAPIEGFTIFSRCWRLEPTPPLDVVALFACPAAPEVD